MKIILALLLIGVVHTANAQVGLGVVKTDAGSVSGTMGKDGTVSIYKGVPFAAPPVGDLRWREPQPVSPWGGVLTCNQFSASPIQNKPTPFAMWTQEFIAPPEPLSEDCLYLNVWTSAKSAKEKRPVFVWIYGGGFVSGSAACAVYDGEAMAKHGIVFVSINYRVGAFGFMAHPELTKESKNKASGNYALMDQLAALKWIRKNIAAFGGDPDRVTIAGQSAGSFSVQALVASPLSKGLFRGAIAQSGASFGRLSTKRAEAEKVGEGMSVKAKKKDIASLRKLSADSVLLLANSFPYGSFSPIVDGYVLTEDMKSIFMNGKHNDVALMAGWVTGDAALTGQPMPAEKFRAFAATTYGDRKDEFLKIFPANTEEEARQSQTKLGIMNFAAFPNHVWASTNKSNSYIYQDGYVPTDKPGFPNYGAFHTSDVPFALHTLALWDRPWTDADYAVEKSMSSYWVNFVKTGNPNGAGLPEWKKYDATTQVIMELGTEPISKTGLFRNEFQFLESVNKK